MDKVMSRVAEDGLTEEVYFKPSFTCGTHNCCEGIKQSPGNWHGVGSSIFWYVLKQGNKGVTLTVSTGEYDHPEYRRAASGDDISAHRPPMDGDEEAGRYVEAECIITGGACSCDGSSLAAHELYAGLGDNPPHEAVLAAMRSFYHSWVG